MALSVWSDVARVVAAAEGDGRLEVCALRDAGERAPALFVEAYGAGRLVAAGELFVWDLNQAIAALLSRSSQARRATLRHPAPGHGGYVDVVQRADGVELLATSRDGDRRVAFTTTAPALVRDLNAVLHHYLTMTRGARTIVLPDAREGQPARARAALIRPAP